MPSDTEAFNLWEKLASFAYIARSDFHMIGLFFLLPGAVRLAICPLQAHQFSVGYSWLHSHLPKDHYQSSRAITLLQPLYILATLEALLSPVCTFTFIITLRRREQRHTEVILFFSLMAISIVLAAVVLALQNLVLSSPLDIQAILTLNPNLSSRGVLLFWDYNVGGDVPLAALILFLVDGGSQIVILSALHLIPSSKRLPKQFQPFLIEKHRGETIVEEPETSSQTTELIDSGPLARLYDGYERQGLISTHMDILYLCRTDFFIDDMVLKNEEDFGWRDAFQEDRIKDGPQLALSDRYWRPKAEWIYLKEIILFSTVQSLLSIGFETARFVSNRRSTQPCQWLCKFGVLAPWPLAIWVVTVLVLVQCRPVLQRRVLGIIRLDHLVVVDLIVSPMILVTQTWVRFYVELNPSGFAGWNIYSLISSGVLLVSLLVACFFLFISISREFRKA